MQSEATVRAALVNIGVSEKNMQFYHPPFDGLNTSSLPTCGHSPGTDDESQRHFVGAVAQLVNRARCMEQIEKNEQLSGLAFDYVFVQRADMMWLRPMSPHCLLGAKLQHTLMLGTDHVIFTRRNVATTILKNMYESFLNCSHLYTAADYEEIYFQRFLEGRGLIFANNDDNLPAYPLRPALYSLQAEAQLNEALCNLLTPGIGNCEADLPHVMFKNVCNAPGVTYPDESSNSPVNTGNLPEPRTEALRANWLTIPRDADMKSDALTVASYAGKDKQVYVDMVAMLGLSLQEQLPEAQRICIVVEGMPQAFQNVLKKAGWTLLIVKPFKPPQGLGGYWSDVYNKVDFFRLPFQQVLALDADTILLRGDSLREFLQSVNLPRGHIGMVKDCCSTNFNSGVMLLQPDLDIHHKIVNLMTSRSGVEVLDQPIINEVYGNGQNIHPMPAIFNVHGYSDLCNEAVIAHFTGQRRS